MCPLRVSDSSPPYTRWRRYIHAGYWQHWLEKKSQQLSEVRDGGYRLRKSTKKARNLSLQHFREGRSEEAISVYIDAIKKQVDRLDEPRTSVLLTGPVRIGKSTTARMVARTGGYFHAEIDHFLFDRSQQIDRDYLVKFGRDLCLALIRNFPDGLLIDAAYEQAVSDVISRDFILDIRDEILVFIAGCGIEDPTARMAAILEYRKVRSCWTNLEASTQKALQELCDEIQRTTLLLRNFSEEHHLAYIPIGTQNPMADIQAASEKIISAVAQR